jgi:hypothetical protein
VLFEEPRAVAVDRAGDDLYFGLFRDPQEGEWSWRLFECYRVPALCSEPLDCPSQRHCKI